jgi:hypothetical protein
LGTYAKVQDKKKQLFYPVILKPSKQLEVMLIINAQSTDASLKYLRKKDK